MGEDIIYYTKKDSLESEEREIIIYCNRDGKVWWDPVTNPFSSMSINPSVGINNSGKKVSQNARDHHQSIDWWLARFARVT